MDRSLVRDKKEMAVAGEAGLEQAGFLSQNMENLGFLASQVAHDLNNTLICITGYAELAMKATENRNTPTGYLEQVLNASQRASRLVQRILNFSRHVELDLKPVDLSALVHESLDFLSIGLSPDIQISRQVPEAKIMALGDSDQLHQVLMNLVINASQAMSAQGGPLEVGLAGGQQVEADLAAAWNLKSGPLARLTVRDHGPGIRPEIQQTMFQPHCTTKGPGQGCGLGLFMVQKIVRFHGGAIKVISRPGWGTEFQIFLPLLLDQASGSS